MEGKEKKKFRIVIYKNKPKNKIIKTKDVIKNYDSK